MTTPAVSVLMPCYNAAETLNEAMGSLVEQSLRDLEIVAVDDGSQDTTAKILRQWSARDGCVKPLFRSHTGLVGALNAGLAACRAPLVARMDADDRAHPRRLERQVAYLAAHAEVAVVGCLVEGFPAKDVRRGFRIYLQWLNSLVTPEAIAREIWIESLLAHPSVVMRRTCLERLGGYQDHGWPEDYDLWLRMHLAGVWRKSPKSCSIGGSTRPV